MPSVQHRREMCRRAKRENNLLLDHLRGLDGGSQACHFQARLQAYLPLPPDLTVRIRLQKNLVVSLQAHQPDPRLIEFP
jgi:hypothetical protein